MKNATIQQEVLFMVNSGLAQRQLCEKSRPSKYLSAQEQLEEACWNGLLEELLPEIMEKTPANERLYKLYIHQGKYLIRIGLSSLFAFNKFPSSVRQQCIDPNFFLPDLIYN